MKKLTSFLLTLLSVLLITASTQAGFTEDIIVTSPDGIWTDSRAYSTLADTVSAIGADERTLIIAGSQVSGTLTIPSNITLDFKRGGSIANTGLLTLNTKNITAADKQIFTGSGDIDFMPGTVVRSAWFSSLYQAFIQTSNDEVTLLISGGHQTIDQSVAVGDNITLKFDSPRNRIIAAAGVELSNIGKIEAGPYQLFAGAGDFDFLSGTELRLSWFNRLRSATAWIESEEITLLIDKPETLDYDTTISSNTYLQYNQGCITTVLSGVIYTINSYPIAGSYQIFTGAGTITGTFGSGDIICDWWDDLASAVASIGSSEKTLKIISEELIADGVTVTIPSTIHLKYVFPGIINGTAGGGTETLTINGSVDAGLYQIFGSDLTVDGNPKITSSAHPEWFGGAGDSTTDSASAVNASLAIQSSAINAGNYLIKTTISPPSERTLLGLGKESTILSHGDTGHGNATVNIDGVSDVTVDNINIDSTAVTAVSVFGVRIDDSNSTAIRNTFFSDAAVSSYPVLLLGDTNKTSIINNIIKTSSWGILSKPSVEASPGTITDTLISGNIIYGNEDAASPNDAKVGISIDGDNDRIILLGNIVRDIQRTAQGTDGFGIAFAGESNGVNGASNLEGIVNIGFLMSDIKGAGLHQEDGNNYITHLGGFISDIDGNGVEVLTGDTPVGTTISHVNVLRTTEKGINVGSIGGSDSTRVIFSSVDSHGSDNATDAGINVGLSGTLNPLVIGNIVKDGTGSGINVPSVNSGVISYNIVSGNSGYGLLGNSNSGTILVESNNKLSDNDLGALSTSAGHNFVGDNSVVSNTIIANVASSEVLFTAQRDGYVTAVRRTYQTDGAGVGGSLVDIGISGGSEIKSNVSISSNGVQYATTQTLIAPAAFSAGDVITVVNSVNTADDATEAKIQVEWFYYF